MLYILVDKFGLWFVAIQCLHALVINVRMNVSIRFIALFVIDEGDADVVVDIHLIGL